MKLKTNWIWVRKSDFLNGIINVYKEKGYTSYDVVAIIKKIFNCSKVGHAGTLDPEAYGVLPICIGKSTKIIEYLTDETKSYKALVTFGITTTTEDHTGEIIDQKKVIFNEASIKNAVDSFIGDYDQTPPMYSAIKINGQRLYKLAREGKTIERKTRRVKIFSIDILKFIPPNKIQIDVMCSKGTYIRTLCADIGKKLNYGAHMSDLERTRVGIFNIANSIKLNDLKKYAQSSNLNDLLFKPDEVLYSFPKIVVKDSATKILYNGNPISEFDILQDLKLSYLEPDKKFLVYDFKNNLVGIYRLSYDNNIYIKPVKMLI